MKSKLIYILSFITIVMLLLAGCTPYQDNYRNNNYGYDSTSSSPYYSDQSYQRSTYQEQGIPGVVTSVRHVYYQEQSNNNHVGAVLGAIVGGVLGHTVGKGDGRTAATVAGAVAGGFAGNEIQKNQAGPNTREYLEITVRLQNRPYHQVTIRQPIGPRFYRGDHVLVIGYGANARVVHN